MEQDFGLWLIAALVNLLVLGVAFQPWQNYVAGQDDFAWSMPQFLNQVGYSYSEYTIHILGGGTPLDLGGLPFFFFLYAIKLIRMPSLFFLLYFTGHLAFTFYSLKILQNCTATPLTHGEKIVFSFIFASMPMIAWQIYAGHLSIIYGAVTILLGISIFLSSLRQQISLTQIMFGIIVLLQAFPSISYQMFHHGIFYGPPLIIALLLLLPNAPSISRATFWPSIKIYGKAIAFPGILFLGCFCLSFYYFYGMYYITHSGDLARSMQDNLTFSFITASATDWWHSLLLSVDHLTNYLDFDEYYSERNFPLGPITLLLLFGLVVLRRKAKIALTIIILWAIIFVLFTMNVHPISDWFMRFVPLCKSWRNQGRAFVIFIPIINIAGLLVLHEIYHRISLAKQNEKLDRHNAAIMEGKKKGKFFRAGHFLLTAPYLYLGCIVLLNITHFSTLSVEIFFWVLLLANLIFYLKRKNFFLPPICLGLLLGGLQLRCYNDRILDRFEHSFGAQIASLQLFLHKRINLRPLEKVVFDEKFPPRVNLGLYTNISSMDGYLPKLRRFLHFSATLQGRPRVDSTDYTILLTSQDKGFEFYPLLYATNYIVNADSIKKVYDSPSWWFPDEETIKVNSYPNLLAKIKNLAQQKKLYKKLIILEEDHALYSAAAHQAMRQDFPPLPWEEQDAQNVLTIPASVVAPHLGKPMVFAINYASILRVVGITQDEQQISLPTFAADGPLLGCFLPTHLPLKSIQIMAVHPYTSWSPYVPWIGALMIILTLLLTLRLTTNPRKFTPPA